jgi:hypothetical protein
MKLDWNDYLQREKEKGLEGQLMHELNTTKEKWEDRDSILVYCDFDWGLFEFVTGLGKADKCVNELGYTQLDYKTYELSFQYFVDGDIIYSNYFVFDNDVLGLFTHSEYGSMTVENFFNDNVGAVIQRLKDYAPDVVDEIEDRFFRSLQVQDLTCPLREEVREDYLKNVRPSDFADYIEGCFPDLYNEIAERVGENIKVADVPPKIRTKIILDYLATQTEMEEDYLKTNCQ